MRKWHPYLLTMAFTIVACSGNTPEVTSAGTGTDTDTDTGSGTETGTSTTTTTGASASATTTASTGSDSNSMSGTGNACVPGMSVACTCMDGTNGAQVCNPDGMSFAPCECTGGTTNGTTTDGTTTDPTTTSTTDPTTTTTDTDTSGTTDMTTGDLCEDPGPEPNEEDGDAVDLGNTQCFTEPGTVDGVLNGEQDVDFFTFHAQDGMSCGFGDPHAVATVTADEEVLICVYVDCDQGNNDFGCSGGSDEATSPGGVPGCCAMGMVDIAYNCSGTMNESANVFISLSGAAADACLMYSIEWDFAGA